MPVLTHSLSSSFLLSLSLSFSLLVHSAEPFSNVFLISKEHRGYESILSVIWPQYVSHSAMLNSMTYLLSTFQALKKRQEEVEAIRRKQEEERKKREEFDREGRHQVLIRQPFFILCLTLTVLHLAATHLKSCNY